MKSDYARFINLHNICVLEINLNQKNISNDFSLVNNTIYVYQIPYKNAAHHWLSFFFVFFKYVFNNFM